MVNIYMNRYSTSLVIKEMQSKTTLRYYLTHVRIVLSKVQKLVSVGKKRREGNTCALLMGM